MNAVTKVEKEMAPLSECYAEDEDSKYFANLSTILVAYIQEVKDRISQIEFIFCSQLFPNFQLKSKNWKKKVLELQKEVEDNWTKKENTLLQQLEDLTIQNGQMKEEIHSLAASLEAEKSKLATNSELFAKQEHEMQMLQDKIESMTTVHNDLKEQLRNKAQEMEKKREREDELLEMLNLRTTNILNQKKQLERVITAFAESKKKYLKLKHQYEYLVGKVFPSPSSKSSQIEMADEETPSKDLEQPRSLQAGLPDASWDIRLKEDEGKHAVEHRAADHDDSCDETQEVNRHGIVQAMDMPISGSMNIDATKCFVTEKSNLEAAPLAGVKRQFFSWVGTRSRENPKNADPHDDFLDTPLENLRKNVKTNKGDIVSVSVPLSKQDSLQNVQGDNNFAVLSPQKLPSRSGEKRGYKYVGPVRKKSDRDNLDGVECRQCRKFYDAVLPDRENNNNPGIAACEHHSGVSRHRYKYVPPMTPEGFWNIGFDTDR